MNTKESSGAEKSRELRSVDNSLRGAAMRRATKHKLPRTMTPYEWHEWYRENGVPPEHRNRNGRIKRKWLAFVNALGAVSNPKKRR